MLPNRVRPQYIAHYPQPTAWERFERIPELVDQVIDLCDSPDKIAFAGVSKPVRICATAAIWHSADPRVFTVLANCSVYDGIGGSHCIHIKAAPTALQWEAWLPLAQLVRVFRDDSVKGYSGLEKEDIRRLNTTRPILHLFPNLHTAYLYDYNILPLFMSPNLSTVHFTITPDLLERQSHICFIANALEDYPKKVTELHVYPSRDNNIQTGQSKVISDICHLIASVYPTLVHASFPTSLITWHVVRQLMRCSNLRSVGHNIYGLKSCMDVCRGSERDIVESYSRRMDEEGDLYDALPFDNPFPKLTSIDITVPHSDAALRIFTGTALPNLESVELRFLGSQQGAHAKFDLGPLLKRLYQTSPRLKHLGLFVLAPPLSSLKHIAPVKSSALQFLIKFKLLESFQFIHPYPVDISCSQLGKLLSKLSQLTKFILNPHPAVHMRSSFGVDVLFDVANSRPEMKELGLFFNKPVDKYPDVASISPFPSLETLYVGTSMVSQEKKPFKDVCYWLLALLPADVDIEQFPSDFHLMINKRCFTVQPDGGDLIDAKLRTYIDACQLWKKVDTTMDMIKDLRKDNLLTD